MGTTCENEERHLRDPARHRLGVVYHGLPHTPLHGGLLDQGLLLQVRGRCELWLVRGHQDLHGGRDHGTLVQQLLCLGLRLLLASPAPPTAPAAPACPTPSAVGARPPSFAARVTRTTLCSASAATGSTVPCSLAAIPTALPRLRLMAPPLVLTRLPRPPPAALRTTLLCPTRPPLTPLPRMPLRLSKNNVRRWRALAGCELTE